jgi:hypothetical protein
MLQIVVGRGSLTVMPSLAPFYNSAIGQLDHAQLFWWLASQHNARPEVWLVRDLELRSLPGWLAQNAMSVLIALGSFIVLALWHAVPRFGPLLSGAEPERRSLVEHLAATGRFFADNRQLPKLLIALRQDCMDLIGARMPEARLLDRAARIQLAARSVGLRERDLAAAFDTPGDTPRNFTGSVRLLAHLRTRLGRRSLKPPRSPGRASRQVPAG